MAKKPKKPAPHITAAAAGAAALAAGVPQIIVPPGGTLRVLVDVGPMTIPYTVTHAGQTVIKSLVDRAELIALLPGTHFLHWAFAHTMKNWQHTIAVSVNGGAVLVLESKSEKNKDADHSVGFAVVN